MRWVRAAAVVAVALVAAAVVGWWLFSGRISESLRATLETELSHALERPVRLRSLSLGLAPPRVIATGFELGAGGELARVGRVDARLLPLSSVKQLRPVAELAADDVWVDVVRLSEQGAGSEEETQEGAGVPSLRLRRVDVRRVRLRLPAGASPLSVSAGSLQGELSVGGHGRVVLDAAAREVGIERRGEELALGRLALRGRHTHRGFIVDDLAAEGPELDIEARLTQDSPLTHALNADVRLAAVSGLDERTQGLAGRLRIDATLTGSLDDPHVAGSVRLDDLRLGERAFGDLRAEVERSARRIEIRSARLAGLGGELTMDGSLTTSGSQAFRIGARWNDLQAREIATAAGAPQPPALRLGGTLDVTGTLEPLTVEGSGRGRMIPEAEAAPLLWELDAERKNAVDRLELAATQGEGNRLQARVTLDAGERLGGEVNVAIRDAGAVQTVAGVEDVAEVGGSFRLSARLSGTLSDPEIEGEVSGERVRVGGTALESAGGRFAADKRRVRADDLRLRLAGGAIVATGTFGIDPAVENAWRLNIEDLDVDALADLSATLTGTRPPLTGGRLSASVSGNGPWATASLSGDVKVLQFQLAGEPFSSLDVALTAELPSWNAEARVVHREGETLTASLQGTAAERVAAGVESTSWALGSLRGAAKARLSGTASVRGEVRGPVNALDGEIELGAEDLNFRDRPLGKLRATATAAQGEWRARLRLLDGAVQASGALDRDGTFSVDAEWNDAEIGPLLTEDPTLRVDTTGRLTLSGDVERPLEVDGVLTLASLTLASGTFRVEAVDPVRARARKGELEIESFHLAGNGTSLQVGGRVGSSGEVHLTAEGSGSLQIVEAVGGPIESSRGQFDLSLRADRPVGGELDLGGQLSLQKAALDFGLPFGITRTNGEIAFQGSQVVIESLSGRMGGGTFTLDGTLDLERGPDVGWQVTEMSTGLVPDLEHELSGKGRVRGAWRDLEVSGEIEILRALYDRRIDITSFLPSFKRQLPEAPERVRESGPRVRLDLHVFAPDELFIDNNFARIEAQANLKVRGNAADPKLDGQIQVITGEVFFRDRTFDVTRAVIDFRPELGFTAFLNILAETEISTTDGTYTVRLQITGTTDNPRVAMTSDDPSLTQNDIASLIAFGRTVAQLQEEGGGVSVSDVLLLAPGGYPEKAEKGAAALLGLDRVEFEPVFSRTTGQFEPQLTVGKDFTEDLAASLATTFGATTSQIFRLTYQLTHRFSLLGIWETESQNQDGAVGGGLKYRREFRDLPGVSLLLLGRTKEPEPSMTGPRPEE